MSRKDSWSNRKFRVFSSKAINQVWQDWFRSREEGNPKITQGLWEELGRMDAANKKAGSAAGRQRKPSSS